LGHVCAGALVAACTLLSADAGSADEGRADGLAYHPVADHFVRIDADPAACWLVERAKGGNDKRFKLDLKPPCYLVMWKQAPPKLVDHSVSDGVPIGTKGTPMAFRYKVARGTVAMAVIGDPPSPDPRPDSLYQLRRRDGYHCTDSLQGVRFRGARVQLMPKAQGFFCVETSPDEKDFWMIAHD
jgi:hypothetical protein